MKKQMRILLSMTAAVSVAGATLGLAQSDSGIAKPAEAMGASQIHGYNPLSIVGAKVVGPGSNPFGVVKDVIRDAYTGEVAMYLVESYGWFDGKAVIPISDVVGIRASEENGEMLHILEVGVNKATFKNLAKWDGEGDVSRYLKRYSSILATVYGLDERRLDANAERYQLGLDESSSRSGDLVTLPQ